MNVVLIGFLASLFAGLATFVGALPVLLPINLTQRVQGIMLGFGGGVMLAATAFSLIVPGTEAAEKSGFSRPIAALIMVVGILLGGIFLQVAHHALPHEHFLKGRESCRGKSIKQIWLFIAAITIHNFPEGLAVGVNAEFADTFEFF